MFRRLSITNLDAPEESDHDEEECDQEPGPAWDGARRDDEADEADQDHGEAGDEVLVDEGPPVTRHLDLEAGHGEVAGRGPLALAQVVEVDLEGLQVLFVHRDVVRGQDETALVVSRAKDEKKTIFVSSNKMILLKTAGFSNSTY